jgi:NAD(P)-dependent dehydrogenase (short-subunit alcohol dehydrogenase family)
MKIIVIGASGLIGSAIVSALTPRHEVIAASRKSATHPVDITDKASIAKLFAGLGTFDAVISAAGGAAYRPLADLTDADFAMSLGYKLMGQVNLARLAVGHLSDGGSITLTTGVYAKEPPPNAAAIAMVNSGVNGYVIGAAGELPRGIRINAVSPPLVGPFRLNAAASRVECMTPEDVALAYVEAVEGRSTGRVIDTRSYARRT